MTLARFLAVTGALFVWAATAASNFSPLKPPAIPLAVRSPYFSTWLSDSADNQLPGTWPRFWHGQIAAWQGFVRVDNVPYNWMGAASGADLANQTSFSYTSTQSIFTFDVAGIQLTATFLSPVYPNDLVKQSLPYSYLQVAATPTDGKPHKVQVYVDMTGEWASSDSSSILSWKQGTSKGVQYHTFSLQEQVKFKEIDDMAQWGSLYFGAKAGPQLTYSTGSSANTTREQFMSTGRLSNSNDTNPRAIKNDWPVFAFAQDLGTVNATLGYGLSSANVVFALGLAQTDTINFQGKGGRPTSLQGLWTTKWKNGSDALVDFLLDWKTAQADAAQLDAQIQGDALNAGGLKYAALATLAVRQSFGALTVTADAGGSAQDPYVFLKEISSDGDIQTVDVIFPAHPVLLYLNPELLKRLLDPLFEVQESGQYPNPWAIHDLGVYPNALGYPKGDDEAMPVEECGNMILLALAYAQRANDAKYLAQHWSHLNQWAQFLVNDSLIPDYQLSTDDFAGKLANQTNLALKGIIGLRAMAEIATLAASGGASVPTDTAKKYNATAEDYLTKWMGYGIAADANPPHTTLSYGSNTTYNLLYNLYADRLLNLKFVPDRIYDMQSNYYKSQLSSNQFPFGLPLDSRHTWVKSDWEAFAGAVADADAQKMIIDRLFKFASTTSTTQPMTDLFDAVTGNFPADGPTFLARPVVGGLFALLALPKSQY